MDSDEELKKALKIINNLVDNLAFLPYTFGEEKVFEISDDISEFMEKHDPLRWQLRKSPPLK